MNMPRITFVFAVIFIVLGVGAYLATGAESVTALIPSFIGVLLAICGAIGLKHLKHGMHAAAVVGLLGFLGTLPGLLKLPVLLSGGEVARPPAVITQSLMAVLSAVFLALCIKSFIDARRARQANLS